VETLTQEERAFIQEGNTDGLACKMLRMIDQLTEDRECALLGEAAWCDEAQKLKVRLAETEEERARHEHNAMVDEQALIEEHQKRLVAEAEVAALHAAVTKAAKDLRRGYTDETLVAALESCLGA
jgi:hypothetical protein